eukprot:2924936-Pyramimonas_sp.AAC.1
MDLISSSSLVGVRTAAECVITTLRPRAIVACRYCMSSGKPSLVQDSITIIGRCVILVDWWCTHASLQLIEGVCEADIHLDLTQIPSERPLGGAASICDTASAELGQATNK